MFNHPNPSRNSTPQTENCRTPEVADAPQLEGDPSEDTQYAPTDLDTFRVFLKRNLRPQSPPTGLLANIRARVDEISTAE